LRSKLESIILLFLVLTVSFSQGQECIDGSIIYNDETSEFNFCENGIWVSKESHIEPLIDIDGNTYKTIKIGNQWWMAENLKVTHYNDGAEVPNITDMADWKNTTNGACCSYYNDSNHLSTYGLLYNWYAVNDIRKLAPEGWHIPTDEEWKQLEIYLGLSESEADEYGARGTDEGSKLKSTSGWHNDGNGTDESGFTALPGGNRNDLGTFGEITKKSQFWTSFQTGYPMITRTLSYLYPYVYRWTTGKTNRGLSVRCIKD